MTSKPKLHKKSTLDDIKTFRTYESEIIKNMTTEELKSYFKHHADKVEKELIN